MSRIKKILDFHGGLENKAVKIVEEAGEASVEIMKILTARALGKPVDNKKLTKELADIEVVIEQIKLDAGITGSDIGAAMEEKISREVNRIDNNFYPFKNKDIQEPFIKLNKEIPTLKDKLEFECLLMNPSIVEEFKKILEKNGARYEIKENGETYFRISPSIRFKQVTKLENGSLNISYEPEINEMIKEDADGGNS